VTLMGQFRHTAITGKVSSALRIAERVFSLAKMQNDARLLIGAHSAVGAAHYFLGHFDLARQHVMCGVEIWRLGGLPSTFEEIDSQAVACLCHQAWIEWHFGEIIPCQLTMAEAISLAKQLNDMHGLALALSYAGVLGYVERNPAKVEQLTSELIGLSTRQNFAHWLATGAVQRGWASAAAGDIAKGISCIEVGIKDYRAIGSILYLPFLLALKAEALHLAGRSSEALETIKEAQAFAERFENRYWSAELHRLRGVFLAAVGADDTEVEDSFRAAISTAKEQKSVSLEKRAEVTYAEYRGQKASALGGRGIRLPL
jgi:tetratricopeptide (TPR) repeat protein